MQTQIEVVRVYQAALARMAPALGLLALLVCGCGGRLDNIAVDGCSGAVGCDAGLDDTGRTNDGAVGDAASCGLGSCSPGSQCSPDNFCNVCLCGQNGSWSCTDQSCADSAGTDGNPAVTETGAFCPSDLPLQGTACLSSLSCSYPSVCGQSRASCIGGSWQVAPASCPGPGCPASEPANASVCATPPPDGCAWPNSCGGMDRGICASGSWSIQRVSCGSVCPSTEPYSGTACSPAPGGCSWDNGCGGRDTGICSPDGTWAISHVGCFPPCPATWPWNGTACPAPNQQCQWKLPCGLINSAACIAGKWSVDAYSCP